MSSVYNAITFFPSRLLTLGNLGIERAINTIDSIAEPIIQSSADKLEVFPESYPRAMHVIEPRLIDLFNFSNNYPKLSTALASTIITITAIAQIFLITSIALVFPSLTIPVTIFAPLYSTFCILATIILYATVTSELEKRYLNKTDDITKLGEAFFNIDSESVSKLNIWSAEQRITGNSNWHSVRKKLVRFFLSPSSTLDLNSSELHSLPDIFDAPVFRKLKYLDLKDNHLTSLPPSIINLQSLRTLNLSRNSTLDHLPEVIHQLPFDCRVNITNCNFSQINLEILETRVNHSSYNGPRITYSLRRQHDNPFLEYNNYYIEELRRSTRELIDMIHEISASRNLHIFDRIDASRNESQEVPSVEQSLRNLYNINGRPYRELSNLTEIPNLDQWLYKLFNTADFNGQLRQSVANRVINYLERANENSSYREIFSATILDAVNTCGDRVTLSVLKLGVTYQLSTVDVRDTQRIHYLLTKGTWALELLHGIARQKISSMESVDHIEVYLGYPIKLKRELNLPIDVEDMLYFRFSALTDEDLEIAKNTVLTTLSNEEEHLNFLIGEPQWIDTLKLNYREQYSTIEEKRNSAFEEDGSNDVESHLVYQQELKNLTKQVLRSFNI